ncbi:uncharacterized protein RCC_07022 [Ramularia collo-cygni]|uniref:Uncharacterized protein n=1 Tax=Ramularia collo-cygni TaxID=112498 RepID=A0A2D3UWK2_9PEZI|nr:uncharacterized protein RCC_07022 [Ramularia collo-cygni]CZT21161.1 uncharacterized protein RCC_07022 [Ramularia collo-cygni]
MVYFPLAMVVVATALSATYKHCYSRKLTWSVRRTLPKYHAFATEFLQLITLGAGLVVGWDFFSSKTIMLDIYIIPNLDFPIPVWFMAAMTVFAHLLSLLAIDLIDNQIQLGRWSHPIQTQTLLLTRSCLASWSVWKRRRRVVGKKHIKKCTKKQTPRKKTVEPVLTTPYSRKRTASEPVTPEMLRRFLREIPVEVSKSGVLIREARLCARRASAAGSMGTPTKPVGTRVCRPQRTPPESVVASGKYDVQSRVEVIASGKYDVQSRVELIERAVGGM